MSRCSYLKDTRQHRLLAHNCRCLVARRKLHVETGSYFRQAGGAAENVTFQLQVVEGSATNSIEALLTNVTMAMAVGEVSFQVMVQLLPGL